MTLRAFRLQIHATKLEGFKQHSTGLIRRSQAVKRRMRIRYFLSWWQRGRCYRCERQMVRPKFGTYQSAAATLDHIRPKSDHAGMQNNMLLACQSCNEAKAAKKPRACEVMVAQFAGEAYSAWLAT